MLSTLLKIQILAEDVCCIFVCHHWANLLPSQKLTNCQSVCVGGGEFFYAIRNRNSNIFPRISSIKGIGVLINFETKSIVYYYILRLFEGRLLQNMQKVQESI